MRVLDASFLIDYEHGVEATKQYLLSNQDEEFVVPAPVHTEYMLGEVHSSQQVDIPKTRHELSWATIHSVSERTSVCATEVADEIGPEGPKLSAVDSLVAGMGRELDAPIVASDGDLTHPTVQAVVSVEKYR
jgi:predicted nucleic acid-binding protein